MFNLFEYGALLVENLIPIEHKKLLRAFGVEQLLDFQSQMSTVPGRCLIAVDGCDSEQKAADSDSIALVPEYAFIVVQPASNTNVDLIFKAAKECQEIAKEINRKMLIDNKTRDSLLYRKNISSVKFTGIGPIGDNFYGCACYFSLTENYTFKTNPDLWLK